MGFDKEGFKKWIDKKFSYDVKTKILIENIVEYGIKNLDYSKNQLVNFIEEVLDEPTIEEIKRFEIKEKNKNMEDNMKNKKMNYKEIRNMIEKMENENNEDFIKALISFEKGVNDISALDKIYQDYMESDTFNLLNEEFDYKIEELRENGEIDESITFTPDRDDFTSVVGNIVGDVDVIDKKMKNGEILKVVNFTVGNHDEEGNNVYINCSAYGEKTELPKNFKQGDFVKISGILKYTTDDKGKEYTNLRVVKSKMLKVKEKSIENSQKKGSIKDAIRNYKEKDDLKEKIEARIDKIMEM